MRLRGFQMTVAPPRSQIAIDLIVGCEITDRAYYDKVECHPSWPGGASGVTIGIGDDLGYRTEASFRADWGPLLDAATVEALIPCIGVQGSAAKALAAAVAHLVIPFDAAETVFLNLVWPRTERQVLTAFPGSETLPSGSFGALVSLVYNRGPALADAPGSDRRREMRQIAAALPTHPELVPDLIRSMKRLWVGAGMAGLLARRDAEADLFQAGLAVA